MPLAQRTLALMIVVGLGAALVASCGGNRAATGFCASIGRGHAQFDSTDADHAASALAEFDRVAASAPANVAPDLKIVHTYLELIYTNPKGVVGNLALFERFAAATKRVDAYLKHTCGVSIPKPVKA